MPETQPEPLSAILAEMRKAVVPMICGRPKIEAVSIRDVLQWADRIEAAAERELSKNRPNNGSKIGQFGNAAAMQRALNSISDIAEDAFGGPERYREASQGRALSLIVDTARAALSKPARNVDRFQTYEEAVKAYRAWTYQNTENVSNVSGLGMLGWLFAPAEGGDHA